MRETFRAWIETLETFVLEVIFEERHDFKARLTRGFLFGGSKVFTVAVKIRRWLYNVRILRDKTLGVQVIAAPWREDLCLRVARQLEAAGVVSAPVADSPSLQNPA